ncbi:sugar transferase [Yaniella halotolerans]|uniref:sugar transferase n=1 Tax=Yaniella halotolerans TaxID=225453 RepID=UPI0003B45A31|nr:sugar transferase [Yaniella halotolerans]
MTHGEAYDRVKRGLDVVGAGIGLVLLSPVIGAVAVAVRTKLGRPVIFRQHRPGKNGELFTLYKFRSMLFSEESDDVTTDEVRMTNFGRKLRSTSLDELPSLVNVLKGEMSFVGPRPLLIDYVSLYTHEQWRRHEVLPGITGLAQVNGRNDISWEEKFHNDIEYVDHKSLKLDLSILYRTLITVILRRGVSRDGHATTVPFAGK